MRSRKNRQSLRLPRYDYTRPGHYFVTICTQDRACLFGRIEDGQVFLNELGLIVLECWQHIETHFPGVQARDVVVMPNHIHGIITIHAHAIPQGDDAPRRPKYAPRLPPSASLSSTAARATHASPAARATHASPLLSSPASPAARATHASPAARATHASPLLSPFSPSSPSSPDTRATHASLLLRPTGPDRASLGAIVGSFKSAAARKINILRKTPGAPVWHRNYHERILRDLEAVLAVRKYIRNNPARWQLDREHPYARMSRVEKTLVLPVGAVPWEGGAPYPGRISASSR